MTIRELDRLVSKTELTPTSKLLLKAVRRSALRGKVQGPQLSRYAWSVIVEDFGGPGAKFTFSLRHEKND